MTIFTAVGFDLDGTLVDHRGAATEAADCFVRAVQRVPSESTRRLWFAAENEQFEQWRQGHVSFQEQRRRRLRAFLPAIDVAVPDADEELDSLFAQYLVAYRAAWRPYSDAVPVLSRLRAAGIAIGVLTNGNHEQQLDKLHVTGLRGLVDVICSSESIGFPKPDARAFRALARELRVKPAELVFLGDDRRNDLEGARAAGIRSGLVSREDGTPVDLEAALRAAR